VLTPKVEHFVKRNRCQVDPNMTKVASHDLGTALIMRINNCRDKRRSVFVVDDRLDSNVSDAVNKKSRNCRNCESAHMRRIIAESLLGMANSAAEILDGIPNFGDSNCGIEAPQVRLR